MIWRKDGIVFRRRYGSVRCYLLRLMRYAAMLVVVVLGGMRFMKFGMVGSRENRVGARRIYSRERWMQRRFRVDKWGTLWCWIA